MPFGLAPELFDGGISAALGLFLIIAELREMDLAMASEEWPTVDGTIEETGVLFEAGTRYGGFAPKIRYHYEVGGKRYVSDRLWFAGATSVSVRAWAERIADRYAGQSSVKVYVSPDDPRKAVLEPGTHWGGWLFLGVGILFFGIGLTGLLAHWGIVTTSIQFK